MDPSVLYFLSGRTLVGTLQLGQVHRGGGGAAPTSLPLVYIVPPPKQANSNSGSGNGKPASSDDSHVRDESFGSDSGSQAQDSLNAALRDAKIKFIKVRTHLMGDALMVPFTPQTFCGGS